MGGFQFIPKHGHALMTRRNRTVLHDREKVSVDHKRQSCLFWSEEKNVSCQWSTKHDLAVVQQNGREGKKVISLYICLCSSCHDNLFTMPCVHFMAFYFQTFIHIDNDI